MEAERVSAQGSYNPVAVTVWDDAKVYALSEDARVLFVYLLTNRLRTAEGFYALPKAFALDQLHWDMGRLVNAAVEIEEADLAIYELRAGAVLIVKGLKYNVPNVKQIPAAIRKLAQVQDAPRLFERFLSGADRYAPNFADAIRKHYHLGETR